METPNEIFVHPRRITLGTNSTFALKLDVREELKNKVEWKSSNNDIATVANGVVSAISPGCAEISARIVNTTNYSTCTVLVAEKHSQKA